MKSNLFILSLSLIISNLTISPSTVSRVRLFGRNVFIKRDDLNVFLGINGNKSRKLPFLTQMKEIDTIVSFGGSQSNAMIALAKVTKQLNMKFIYITKNLPAFMKGNPIGNFQSALLEGMEIVEVKRDFYRDIVNIRFDSNVLEKISKELPIHFKVEKSLFIPQGVAIHYAAVEIKKMAKEIAVYIHNHDNGLPWKVLFASGTGTTAFYTHQYFRNRSKESTPFIEVIAIPCVDADIDLQTQMVQLASMKGSVSDNTHGNYNDNNDSFDIPTILSTVNSPSYEFARPYEHHLKLWKSLCESSGIDSFDLIYAPRAFEVLMTKSYKRENQMICLFDDPNINLLYYHCGGSEGNISQLARYKRMNMVP